MTLTYILLTFRRLCDEEEAAVRIQAMQRGRKLRGELKDKQAAAAKIQALQRGGAARHRHHRSRRKHRHHRKGSVQSASRLLGVVVWAEVPRLVTGAFS